MCAAHALGKLYGARGGGGWVVVDKKDIQQVAARRVKVSQGACEQCEGGP